MLQNAFYLIAFSLFASIASASSIGTANYTYAQANSIIANVTNYVSLVNASSYLIFSPNLTLSYAYLNEATTTYRTSPSAAAEYAFKAQDLAQQQYGIIQNYKKSSIYIIAAIAIVSFLILYVLMKPIKIMGKKKG